MEIRRARLSESEAIANLFLRSFRSALPTVRLAHSDNETRQWYHEHLLPNTDTWVATNHGVIIGFISLSETKVEQLYLDPDELRRGVGTKLIELAKQQQPQGLTLATFQKNTRAQKFYEHLGFKVIRTTDGSDNEEHEPDIFYEWKPKA